MQDMIPVADLTPFGLEHPEYRRLSALPVDDLVRELRDCLTITVKGVIGAARAWRVLHDKGVDLSDFRGFMVCLIERIAFGQMLPELALEFWGQEKLLKRLSSLPLHRQQAILRGEKLQVAERAPDGLITHRLVAAKDLTAPEMALVFDRNDVRRVEAQGVMLDRRREALPECTVLVGGHRVVPDRGIFVGGKLITWLEVEEARKYRAGK
jgi:hypothetical protein